MFRTPISRFATLFRNPNPHKLLPTDPIPIITKKARIFGPKQKLKMPSQQILPITYHPPSSNPAATEKLLVKSEEDPSTRLLLFSHFEDEEKAAPLKPLLPKSASYTFNTSTTASASAATAGSANNNQKRRRRTASDNSLYSSSSNSSSEEAAADSHSIAGDVEHAAAETYLITRLSLKLLSYLGVGYRWITRFLALGCYSFLLMPGFIQVGYYYFFSKQVRRGIVYGDQPRNRLDLYLPKNSDGPKPVIAFVTGGAWIIGYKAWGSLLGIQLSERDIIVACIDYRNFPQGTISDMVQDASQGISFVCNHIAEYGGDPDRVYVMGQSAGAHIGACSIVDQAIKELGEGESTSWSVSQIKAYFGLSGGYNLFNLVDHFHSRGLYRSIFLGIMEGEHSLQRFSPEVMIQDPNVRSAASLLPPIILFHGTADYSIPSDASKNFAETLRSLGVKAESILYEGKTHTDLFLQDPMRGGKDEMFEDLVAIIHEGDSEALAKDAVAPPRRRLVPEFMLKLAHKVSPF
ncbi:putative isoprenylcysteine alpha-carbonyl methylesterase ICMEL1 [Rosa sericea]